MTGHGDEVVSIPGPGPAESLHVSGAAGLFLCTAARSRIVWASTVQNEKSESQNSMVARTPGIVEPSTVVIVVGLTCRF